MVCKVVSRAIVVLVRPQGPINIGLTARACANLGVSELRLVAPECDIHSLDARMFAHHAQDNLKVAPVLPSVHDAVADCSLVVGTTARQRRDSLTTIAPLELQAKLPDGRFALVFGNESNGLSREELEACDLLVSLDTPGPYPSYNLSHAVAILLYTLTLQPPREQLAEASLHHGELRRLYDFWLKTLEDSGYFRRTDASRFAPKLWRMLQRLHVTQQDANTLWGMLTQFQKRSSAND